MNQTIDKKHRFYDRNYFELDVSIIKESSDISLNSYLLSNCHLYTLLYFRINFIRLARIRNILSLSYHELTINYVKLLQRLKYYCSSFMIKRVFYFRFLSKKFITDIF